MMSTWDNDAIQFPRLIGEAIAAGAFTEVVVTDMASSMDLDIDQVLELIDRAQSAWDRIVDLTPDGPFPQITWPAARYIARFIPQAWVNDYAVDVDPEGEQEWDCTAAFSELPEDYRAFLLEEIENDDEALDNDDLLFGDPASPEWVRNHHGPFSIWIRRKAIPVSTKRVAG